MSGVAGRYLAGEDVANYDLLIACRRFAANAFGIEVHRSQPAGRRWRKRAPWYLRVMRCLGL